MTDFLGRPPVLKRVPPRSTKIKSIEQLREELSPINKGIRYLDMGKASRFRASDEEKSQCFIKNRRCTLTSLYITLPTRPQQGPTGTHQYVEPRLHPASTP